MSGLSRREFLDVSWKGVAAWFLAACGRAPLPPDILPTLPPLPDLLSTGEVDRKGDVTIARIELTEKALGGEKTGKANLEVIRRTLKNFGFEDGALENQQVALWAPIETKKFLMYKVHPDTKELFSIGRLYAYHPRAQRFLEVPVLLRAELSADGQSFLFKTIEAVSLDVNVDEAKKRSYAVRAATLKVLDDEKRTAELATDPTFAPRFSFEIESTINGQNQPIIVGTRKYALGMMLADLNGSQVTGDEAYTKEATFRRFIIPAQEQNTFREQPAVLRESQVSNVVQEEISSLIADKKITRAKIVALTTEQWGGTAIASKDAAIVFTPDLVSDVTQEAKDADKRKLQGKYFLAVKSPKKTDDSGSLVRTISLSSQIDPEWQLIEFPLKLVTREDGSTYLELINELFGIRLAVGVKVEDKKLQVLGDQLFAFAFGPSQLQPQTSPLQVAGENLQRMFNEMKEVKGPEIVWKKDFYSVNDFEKIIKDFPPSLNRKHIQMQNLGLIGPDVLQGILVEIQRGDRYDIRASSPLLLIKIAVEKRQSGEMVAHLLYFHSATKANTSPLVFKVSIPLEDVVVSQTPTPSNRRTVNSLLAWPEDQRVEALKQSRMQQYYQHLEPSVFFRSPKNKTTGNLLEMDTGIPLRTTTQGYLSFLDKCIKRNDWNPFLTLRDFQDRVGKLWAKMFEDYLLFNGNVNPVQLVSEMGDDWMTSKKIPQLGSSDGVYFEPFFSN